MTTWPTFLVLSPSGGGGEQLAGALRTLPGVCMPEPDIGFFSTEWDRGATWYAARFDACGGALAVGEFSRSYVRGSTAPTVAARIDGFLEDVRLVGVVRHPAVRARAMFDQLREAGRMDEGVTFERALEDEEDRWGLRAGSHYSHWLVPYTQRFGRRLLALPIDGQPASTLAETVLDHLGLPLDLAPKLQSALRGLHVDPPWHGAVFDDELEALASRFSLTFTDA